MIILALIKMMICWCFIGLGAILEVATDVIKRLWNEVDHSEFSMVHKCLLVEILNCISDGCMMHLKRLLSLLVSTVRQCTRSTIYGEKILFLFNSHMQTVPTFVFIYIFSSLLHFLLSCNNYHLQLKLPFICTVSQIVNHCLNLLGCLFVHTLCRWRI